MAAGPVITGAGAVSAAGCSLDNVWDNARRGQSGLGPLTLFESSRYANHLVGQVRENVERLAGAVRGSRTDKLAWIAARQALEAAGLWSGSRWANPQGRPPSERIGVVVGTTVGGMLGTEHFVAGLMRGDRKRFGVLRFHECAGAAELCARMIGARGPCLTVSTACSAGAMAILAAAELIQSGEVDLVLAGGADSLSRLTLNGFGSLLLLDPAGCRPFDARRSGISLGEGAGMIVMESAASAAARGAAPLAILSGWGASCDAWHPTAPHPDGRGALAAMKRALSLAGLQPEDVGFVAAHGTGTPDNDAMEAKALRDLFGGSVPPVASMMRLFGHTLAASGALKAALVTRILAEQAVPQSQGFAVPDPAMGFVPVTSLQPCAVNHILSNSFGFGGNNVALVFSRPETYLSRSLSARPSSGTRAATEPSRLAIRGIGVISPAGSSLSEVVLSLQAGGPSPMPFDLAPLCDLKVSAYACGDFAHGDRIDPAKRRKLSRFQQMALVAAQESLKAREAEETAKDRVCVAIGTGFGSLNDTAAFVENMISKEERAPRPLYFTNSVHNTLSAQVALEYGLRGMNSTPVQREVTFEASLYQCASELAAGAADSALAGAGDELCRYHLAAGERWGWWSAESSPIVPFRALAGKRRPLAGELCVVFNLGQTGGSEAPLGWISSCRLGLWSIGFPRFADFDARLEADWIHRNLERDGISLRDVDVCVTGANGFGPLDARYVEVVGCLSELAGHEIVCAAYKHGCGQSHSASAFGLLTALLLARGDLAVSACMPNGVAKPEYAAPLRRGRKILLYTLCLGGGKAMTCVHA